MVGLTLGGEGVEVLIKILYRPNFSIKIFIAKKSRVNLGRGVMMFPPQNIIGLKTSCIILYMLVKFSYQIGDP